MCDSARTINASVALRCETIRPIVRGERARQAGHGVDAQLQGRCGIDPSAKRSPARRGEGNPGAGHRHVRSSAHLPTAADIGPSPTLRQLQHMRIPAGNIAPANGWPNGVMPHAAPSKCGRAFARNVAIALVRCAFARRERTAADKGATAILKCASAATDSGVVESVDNDVLFAAAKTRKSVRQAHGACPTRNYSSSRLDRK